MADINQTAAWVTARLTELGNATDDGLNTLVTDGNIGNYSAGNVSGVVAVANGGTGANNAVDGLENLGGIAASDVSTVGKTGDYDDLLNKPTIPTISQTYNASSADGMSGAAVAQGIAAETSRATTAEGNLNTAINNEKTRAQNAESTLNTAITTEKNRAEGVEATLTTSVGHLADNFADAYSASSTYYKGDYVIHDNVLYVANQNITTAEAWNAAHWEQASVKDLLGVEADKDGWYSTLTSGTAEQLLSNNYTEDSVPYSYRQTGGGVAVGNREIEEVVGGSIVWNQLLDSRTESNWKKSSTASGSYSDGVYTFTATQQSDACFMYITIPANHVFITIASVKLTTATTNVRSDIYGGEPIVNTQATTDWQTLCGIGKKDSSSQSRLRIVDKRTSGWDAIQVKDMMFMDLTAMFGSTVADAIYTAEQTVAGSGVAIFRRLFPKDYYAYHAASIESVNVASHETVGFNLWDEEWELGSISTSDGQDSTATNRIRTKGYIPVFPNTSYFFCMNTTVSDAIEAIFWYDSGHNFISYAAGSNNRNKAVTSPLNAYYLRFRFSSAYGATYMNDVCINLSNPTLNGTYKPYQKNTYALDSSKTLMGVWKLAASNKLYCDGDTYQSDGTVTRKYYNPVTITEDMIRNVTTSSGGIQYAIISISGSFVQNSPNILNSKGYPVVTSAPTGTNATGIRSASSGLYVYDNAFIDLATAKASLVGMLVVLPRATVTTETALPYQNPQVCADGGTEEYVDYAVSQSTRDVAIPCGHNTKYPTDMVKKLDGLPSDFSTLIAPTESTTTASQNYAIGSYFILNNTLYKVTSAIASGGTITVGTNCTATTVMAELVALTS